MSKFPTQSISCLPDSTLFYDHEYVVRGSVESAGKKIHIYIIFFSKGKFCGFCCIFYFPFFLSFFFYSLRLATLACTAVNSIC